MRDVRQEIVDGARVRAVPFGLGQRLRFSDGGPWSWCVLKGGWYVDGRDVLSAQRRLFS